jgi:hypothetical protein
MDFNYFYADLSRLKKLIEKVRGIKNYDLISEYIIFYRESFYNKGHTFVETLH